MHRRYIPNLHVDPQRERLKQKDLTHPIPSTSEHALVSYAYTVHVPLGISYIIHTGIYIHTYYVVYKYMYSTVFIYAYIFNYMHNILIYIMHTR